MGSQEDSRFLAASVRLGASALGQTWPNPAVGCLIVRDGKVVGQGRTQPGGRPHAETEALRDAGDLARGATVYVSLEPCNHHGRTPPCSEALIDAGVASIFIALSDPDPRVSGSGATRLQEAGVVVHAEPFAAIRNAALHAHRGHLMRMHNGRPHVTLKLALSEDGAIGRKGEGQVAITTLQTNRLMHGLRARKDAIAVGARTMHADNPRLTVRLQGLEHRSPQRVVFGVDAFNAITLAGKDLQSDLRELADEGVTSLLVEGGPTLANSFLKAGLVDELILLKGSIVLGRDAIKPFCFDPFKIGFEGFTIQSRRRIGDDQMMILAPEERA
jgi:diaminohydroxyphosphoribosylaminopyrimidine deaminase/5-amino-6-(5-phosphoribosylamino)uracil reductase